MLRLATLTAAERELVAEALGSLLEFQPTPGDALETSQPAPLVARGVLPEAILRIEELDEFLDSPPESMLAAADRRRVLLFAAEQPIGAIGVRRREDSVVEHVTRGDSAALVEAIRRAEESYSEQNPRILLLCVPQLYLEALLLLVPQDPRVIVLRPVDEATRGDALNLDEFRSGCIRRLLERDERTFARSRARERGKAPPAR